MAPEYTLNVNIGDKWRTQWAKVPEMKLCFATSVSGGGSQIYSNVVALTSDIAPRTQISWRDNYMIAGSTNKFSNGAKFMATTRLTRVVFGSKTKVANDWTITTNPSSDAPEKGFLFTSEREVAAVLYREINGAFAPIYISHAGPLPPNFPEKLIPRETVYVWFSSECETATMVDNFKGQVQAMEFGGDSNVLEATVTYNDAGQWIVS